MGEIENKSENLHVKLDDTNNLQYWARKLGTNIDKIIIAVHTVRTNPHDVKRWLNENL